jgi:hypothetical protein
MTQDETGDGCKEVRQCWILVPRKCWVNVNTNYYY